jgi:hypothetical protein
LKGRTNVNLKDRFRTLCKKGFQIGEISPKYVSEPHSAKKTSKTTANTIRRICNWEDSETDESDCVAPRGKHRNWSIKEKEA